jgi:hypothetical protein
MVGHYRLEEAIDVFDGMGCVLSCRSATPQSVCSMALCYRVTWHCSGALRVVNRAGAALLPHYSRMSTRLKGIKCTACPHVLQAHNGSDVRHRMRVLEIHEPNCIGRPARFFFIYLRPTAHWEPWDMWQHRDPSWPGGRVLSHRTRSSDGAHHSQEVRSGAIGHVATPEPTSAGR